MRWLQRHFSSEEFTELLAFRRLYTWDPDLWYGLRRHAAATAMSEFDVEDFVPVKHLDEEERRQRRERAAEERMDRDAEER